MGTVAASLIVLGKDWTTGAISTVTFTTDPCICNCPPRGKLYNDMNGILKDINLSSNAYRHSSGGFVGNERPFATASFGILHCLRCTKHVLHNHSLFFFWHFTCKIFVFQFNTYRRYFSIDFYNWMREPRLMAACANKCWSNSNRVMKMWNTLC